MRMLPLRLGSLLVLAVMLLFINDSARAQHATDALRSGDKAYRLGCSLAQKPCVESCGELWSPAQRREQEKRCNEHKKKIADCRKAANDRYWEKRKECRATANRPHSEERKCIDDLDKALKDELNRCKDP